MDRHAADYDRYHGPDANPCDEEFENRIALLEEMRPFAEAILAAIDNGVTVEKMSDADVSIEEARDAARELLKLKLPESD